jgi:hypothetical protein
MIDVYEACRTVTWMWGEGRTTEDEVTCGYGATEASAVANLDEQIDDMCPWWYTFGNMFCYKNKDVQVSVVEVPTFGEFFATFYQKYFG